MGGAAWHCQVYGFTFATEDNDPHFLKSSQMTVWWRVWCFCVLAVWMSRSYGDASSHNLLNLLQAQAHKWILNGAFWGFQDFFFLLLLQLIHFCLRGFFCNLFGRGLFVDCTLKGGGGGAAPSAAWHAGSSCHDRLQTFITGSSYDWYVFMNASTGMSFLFPFLETQTEHLPAWTSVCSFWFLWLLHVSKTAF